MTEGTPPAGDLPPVEVRDLVKIYGGRAVVNGLTFSVQPGEVFALLGPNGAGKTTTVEILEGYRRPDGGSTRVLGLDPAKQGAELKPRIGLMLQQGGLFPQITAREALRLFAAFYPNAEDPDKLIDQLELREVANTRFRQLSGGQKQRLSLGLALVGRPRLVFLDEPTAAMDPQARRRTWNIIRALRDSGLRHAVANEVRFSTRPPVAHAEVAAALALPPGAVESENDGSLVLHVEPSPARIAELTTWLAGQNVLLTELRAGSRSLEQAFLTITASDEPP